MWISKQLIKARPVILCYNPNMHTSKALNQKTTGPVIRLWVQQCKAPQSHKLQATTTSHMSCMWWQWLLKTEAAAFIGNHWLTPPPLLSAQPTRTTQWDLLFLIHPPPPSYALLQRKTLWNSQSLNLINLWLIAVMGKFPVNLQAVPLFNFSLEATC